MLVTCEEAAQEANPEADSPGVVAVGQEPHLGGHYRRTQEVGGHRVRVLVASQYLRLKDKN